MMKKILGLIIALMISVPAFASIAVSPTKVELNANRVKTNYITTAIEIKGDSRVPTRYKAYAGYFKINEKGEVVMIDKSSEPQDISKKIRFVPSEFNVAQGKSQKIRISVTGLNALPDGESRAVLFIEDVQPQEIAIPTGRAGIGAQLIVKTRVGVPIYLDKGKVLKVGEIEYLNILKEKDGLYSDMKILSKGNSKIRYSTTMQIIKGKKLIDEYSLKEAVVGDNNYFIQRAKIKTDKINEVGDYTLRAVISYFDENGKRKNVKKETILKIDSEM